jgi:two-component system chemotaxis sensor kinase CheA
MDELDKEMKMSFIDEARQLLEAAEQCFLDLESKQGDSGVIEQLFRLAHNMKGTSRAVGFGEVAEFTHELENLLLKLKEGILQVDGETVSLLLECNDHIKNMVESLSLDMEARFDSADLVTKIKIKLSGGVIGGDTYVEEVEDEYHASPVESPVIDTRDPFYEPPSAGAIRFEDIPPAAAFEDFDSTPKIAASSVIEAEHPDRSEIQEDSENFEAVADEVVDGGETQKSESVPLEAVAPAPVAVPKVAPKAVAPAPVVAQKPAGGEKKPPATPPSSAQQAPEESIRVSLSRLEKLSDFIGELVILQTVLNQHRQEIPSQLLQRTIGQLGKLSKEIQDISMSLRMIPIKSTFQKLQRIVRDTSKALGKTVDLSLEGEQTEVDKTVLEHIGDPLVHIVRNAIDHGLEMPDERSAVGKRTNGQVVIRAFHQGNNLIIEVVDDGKGIDPQKLLKKAIEKGVVRPGTVMPDADAMMLLFAPGFSTKDQVSEISGRGVGLDVVKTNVERLSGQVQLESTVGNGSIFRVVLPLTLAIIDAMVVRMGEERYVVPVSNVHETVQPRMEDVHHVTGRGEMLSLRDHVIPLFRLSQVLKTSGLPSSKERPHNECIAIIVNNRKQPFAMLVDDIIRQQQIVIKKLGPEIRNQKGLTGSAILGDGKPALILDLNDLVEKLAVGSGAGAGASVRPTAA